MPVDLESRFKRLLREIITISNGIRDSALDHANDQNFDVFERLRCKVETIRVSTDAILEAFAKATLTSYALDERITDWLASGEPHLCLDKLKKMVDMLTPIEQVQDNQAPGLPSPTRNKLTVVMDFLDNHNDLFHFLLTLGVWNLDRLVHTSPEASHVDGLPITHVHQETRTAESNARITTEYQYRPPSHANQEVIKESKRGILKQKLDEISRWLAPLECAQKHKNTFGLRQESTCKWFPSTVVFEKWRTPGSRFLWLHGKGGCGKSVLIASTIEHLKSTLKEEEEVVFFYCDFQNERSTNCSELMRSLLSQLLCHIRDNGTDPGDFPDKVLKQKSEGTLSLDDLGKLCDLVARAASYLRYEPMIVIDALDECADLESLLPALVTLSQSDVRLLVTSRPDQTIMNHFAGLQSLSFEDVTEEVAADIALHVRRELDSHSCLRPAIVEMKDEMGTMLSEKAEGRFRWVQCQLDTLKRCETREELRESLDSLPNELEATYERILGVIDERKLEGQLARRVLALLMVAIEPLQLAQIVDGLSMDFQTGENNHAAQRWLEMKLVHSLSSLVSYHEETDTLALAHYSVKEYLTGRSALPTYRIVTHEAHAEVAQLCMGYISVFLKQGSSCDDVELWECSPMLFYILSSGFNHLTYVDSESTVVLEALQCLGLDVRYHPSHWDRLCELREEALPYPPWPSSRHDFILYILIAYSSPGLFRTFLSCNYPLKPRVGTNPLVYAADLRKTDYAMVLLTCGADVNARGPVIDDSRHATPLEVAIDLGDDVLVGELLRRGCLVTSELLATVVCMPWCSTRILVELVQTDEFAEWALGIGDEKLYQGVFNSARPDVGDSRKADEDHVTLARRLRQLGQDLSADSGFGKELTLRALHAAHMSMLEFLIPPGQPPAAEFLIAASTGDTAETVSVVHFLLRKGVDVHAVSDEGGDTALHLVAMCPWEPRSLELTRLLIDAGCNPRACNSDGETSLTIAVRHGHCSVVEFLLSRNVQLPSDILHRALERRWNGRMIALLIDRGAAIHVVTESGNTVLHRAVIGPEVDEDEGYEDEEYEESECFDLVKRFIEAGCDPTVENSHGETILEIAVELKLTSVADLLLSLDFPVPSDILLVAVMEGWTLEVVESLIRRGANVDSTTIDGDTVLHLVLEEYHSSEEECRKWAERLIDAGCDLTKCNFYGMTALEVATEYELTSVVNLLLSLDFPVPPDILLIAVTKGWTLEVVESLIRRDADVDSTSSNGDTVLHLVLEAYCESEEECYKWAKRFIDAGCDPTMRNCHGKTALEIAIKHNFVSVADLLLSLEDFPVPSDTLLVAITEGWALGLVESLIRKGANVDSTTTDGDTALHLALKKYCNAEEECHKWVKKLVDAGCDLTKYNSHGITALEIAAEYKLTSVVDLLLSVDFPVPRDILLTAVTESWTLEVVESLIRRGADVHSTTIDGDTVLHLVLEDYYNSEEECYQWVKKLIDAGCDPTKCNSYGITALEIATEYELTSVVDLFLSLDFPIPSDILLIAITEGWALEVVESLICRGANVDSTASNGDTLLHLSLEEYCDCEEECHKLVKRLIDAGCDPTKHNSDGKSVLDIAVEYKLTSVVDLLFSSGVLAPPDLLLDVLNRRFTLKMVKCLFVWHAGDNIPITPNGDTPLHLAIDKYYPEGVCLDVVSILIDAGYNCTTRNSDGKTILESAVYRGYTTVVDLLLSENVTLPPDILPFALQKRSYLHMIEFLISKGANVHSTAPNGDTVLHLAINNYNEEACHYLAKTFVDAGYDPSICPSDTKSILEAAVESGYTSVVELLLQSDVAVPPEVVSVAIRCRRTPRMIELLVCKCAYNHLTESGTSWDDLLQLVNISYSGQYHRQIKEILDGSRRAYRGRSPGLDERCMHVAKRPRLE